jgi:hypothetical protein
VQFICKSILWQDQASAEKGIGPIRELIREMWDLTCVVEDWTIESDQMIPIR